MDIDLFLSEGKEFWSIDEYGKLKNAMLIIGLGIKNGNLKIIFSAAVLILEVVRKGNMERKRE